tara:strand:- start:156 stop:302 length:147 start_codon:yes stop_codon:yes gene_type:complete
MRDITIAKLNVDKSRCAQDLNPLPLTDEAIKEIIEYTRTGAPIESMGR